MRKTSIESLEDRQMFAVDPLGGAIQPHGLEEPLSELHSTPSVQHHGVDTSATELHNAPGLVQHPQHMADFWYDPALELELDELLGGLEQTLASAHGVTGLTQVRQNYGFTGAGQTVAIIDSGIAYDHWALGGGFGAGYRVVGGWDFTEENDANPYDDGPFGGHGTHVAGIVGADRTGTNDDGVAPGVDLVALRVFNDAGAGYFNWVENALRWVHENRDAFANPITAVNLSLGTAWNSATIPNWAMLEDEFAQLAADGIFISVSAGNSFANYNVAGLSYPAASSHVVPVMSVDDSGSLSYFSQRHSRAIAAPGRYINSTVPDYVGNHNGVTDDFASYSGTSMAAPYVAGASVLVREAMEFVGYTDIDQWTIYDHLMATADSFFDAATNQWYKRLNLENAIDALIPDDDYGSSVIDAYNIGTLGGGATLSGQSMEMTGLIGKLDDMDYFQFTAGATGTVTITANATHALVPRWTADGTSWTTADELTIDVVAGQTYTVGLKSAGGLGYYSVQLVSPITEANDVTVKTLVDSHGTVYALVSDGWLSVNGQRVWENTRDFALGANGTVYWHSTTGQLARRLATGAWQGLDRDATKFVISTAGTVYSLGVDGWVNVDGQPVWQNTADFAVGADGSIYWLSTGGNLCRRSSDGAWSRIESNVTRFDLRDDGVAYALRTDGGIRVNGSSVWQHTHDFLLYEDQTLYWHGTDGRLSKKPQGGSWQGVESNAVQFAIRHDGTVYTLLSNGNVNVDGDHTWSGIRSLALDQYGSLLLAGINGTMNRAVGQFTVSTKLDVKPKALGGQENSATEGQSHSGVAMAFVGPATRDAGPASMDAVRIHESSRRLHEDMPAAGGGKHHQSVSNYVLSTQAVDLLLGLAEDPMGEVGEYEFSASQHEPAWNADVDTPVALGAEVGATVSYTDGAVDRLFEDLGR